MTTAPDARCPVCGGAEHRRIGPNPDFPGADVLRCASCTLMWSHPVPPPDRLNEQYESEYVLHHHDELPPRYIAHKAARAAAQRAFIRDHADLDRFASLDVLDIGSGIGALLGAIAELPNAQRLVGIEPAAVMRARAEAALPERVELLGGLFDPDRFPGEDFALVTGSHVLEHVGDPVEFLAGVRSRVRPGGYLFLEVPNVDEPEVQRVVDARFGGLMHLLFLDRDSMAGALRAAGWEPRAVAAFGPSRDEFSVVPNRPDPPQGGAGMRRARRVARGLRTRFGRPPAAAVAAGAAPGRVQIGTTEAFAYANDPRGIWLRVLAENPADR